MGPAVDDADSVKALVEAGMDVARLNFSHGDHESHRRMVRRLRAAAQAVGRSVAILQDIQGPKTRVGRFHDGAAELASGDTVRMARSDRTGDRTFVPVDYDRLAEDVEVGARVVLSDGLIGGRVTEVDGDTLVVRIDRGGTLKDRKGIAFPDSDLRVALITDKDRRDLEFGRRMGVDYVAASFVRRGEDIAEIRELAGADVPIIAKVELATAYENLDSILAAADGVMVARGDLGVQLPLETIPNVQADILRRTNQAGLISITATEMLESMVTALRPSRAEVTDVANAVASGTDAVMLSAETAVGRHPPRVVEAMSDICLEAERYRDVQMGGGEAIEFLESTMTFASATAKAATEAARNLRFRTIVAFTESGGTARLLSKYRPSADIMVFAPSGRDPAPDGPLLGRDPHPVRAPGIDRPHVRRGGEVPGEDRHLRTRRRGGDDRRHPAQHPGLHQPGEAPRHRRAVAGFLPPETGRGPQRPSRPQAGLMPTGNRPAATG